MSNLVNYTTTCRRKKGATCRFNAPWTPTDKTILVRSEEKIDDTIVSQSRKLIENYFHVLLQ